MGHSRPVTVVKYNYEGDLLFSASKEDSKDGKTNVCMWLVSNGERVGSFDGHAGAVFSLDVTRDSRFLLTGSADSTARVWEALTGKLLATLELKGPCHGVAWAEGERKFAVLSNKFMSHGAYAAVYDFFPDAPEGERVSKAPTLVVADPTAPAANYTRVAWMPLNESLLLGMEAGTLRCVDALTGAVRREWRDAPHTEAITALAFNEMKTLLVTSSKDKSAVLWDVKDMAPRSTFTLDVPCNAAALSPLRDHVILGGGQEARDVTTTAASAGKFETRFYDLVGGGELGRVKGHFGPIHTLAFAPDGWGFTSGAEDGYIRLHKLDPDYIKLGEEDNLDDPALTRALGDGTFEELEEEERQEALASAAQAAKSKV